MVRVSFRTGFVVALLASCGAEHETPKGGVGGSGSEAGNGAVSGGHAGAPSSTGGNMGGGSGGAFATGGAQGGTATSVGGAAGSQASGGVNAGGGAAAAGVGAVGVGGAAGNPASGGAAGNRASGGAPSPCSGSAGEGGAGAASDDATRPPSCEGLAATCGPCEVENCCESLPVPGGTFLRSYDGDVYKEQTWPATVSDFRLDRFEVTVGRFRPFVDAIVAGWRPPVGAGKHAHLNGGLGISGELGWSTDWNDQLPKTKERWSDDTHLGCDAELSTWTADPGARENHAINCVSWVAAYAFCIWDEAFLPTEAEWNYAAAGGSEQREYPWGGTDPSANLAVYYCRSGGTPGCAWPVGSRPAGDGRFGQADLAGNSWEWALDSANVLSVSWATCASGMACTQYPTAACNDCGYFEETFNRIMRGGSNTDAPKNVRAALRARGGFLDAVNDIGLRCARVP